jgi:PAS domain S-box-containing protein
MMPPSSSQIDNYPHIDEAFRSINREFVRSIPEPVCLLDLECRIIMTNEKAMKLFGHQHESFFIGKSVLDFIVPESHEKLLENIEQCLNTDVVNQSDYLIRTENGTTLPIRTTSFTLSDRANHPIALLSLVKDTSKGKSSEKNNLDSTQKAQLYLDLLGHDISNKLQVMLSSAELLQESLQSHFESRLIQNILESISSCKRIIHGTEILENYNDKHLKVQYLDNVVRTGLLEFIKVCGDITVHANIRICDAAILCDEYITNLLSNILDNAREHNPSNDKQVWITLGEDFDGYILSVSDNGPGITSDTKTNGTCVRGRSAGIGLYICHTLIEKYHGWIQIIDRIKNQPDQGTNVLVWFPKHKQSSKQD